MRDIRSNCLNFFTRLKPFLGLTGLLLLGPGCILELINPTPDGKPLAPENLSYSTPPVYIQNVSITPLTPSVFGTIESWSISPSLPAGLTIDSVTGVISGTPSALSSATTYTVTAINAAGSASTTLVITVNPAAPTALSYSTPQLFTKNSAITALNPTVTGTVSSYSVSPALPSGLSLHTTTGVISGTPTAVTASASYTVTATNVTGSTTFSITIQVRDQAPTSLSYSTPVTVIQNSAMTSLNPSNSGGTITSYSVSPALPSGISLHSTTGVISGTPTSTSSSTNYTVTGSNATGSTNFTINITVNPPAPSSLSYPDTEMVFLNGSAISSQTPTVTGTVTTWSISPSLPAGLSMSSSTGVLSGTPTADSSTTSYTVTASNVTGSTTASFTLRVATGFQVNDLGDATDSNTGDGICSTAGGVCTLRAAVAQSTSGTKIILLPSGTISTGSLITTVASTRVEIIGKGAGTSIVEKSADGHRFIRNNGTGLILRKFTIQNYKLTAASGGAAVYSAVASAIVILDRMTLQSNTEAAGFGAGALSIGANTTLTISKSSFISNTVSGNGYGGAVGIGAASTAVTITDSLFQSNSISAAGYLGGALSVNASGSITLERNLFNSNSAGSGGNSAIYATSSGAINLINNTFTGNTQSTGVSVRLDSSATLTNNTFANNTSTTSGPVVVSMNGGTLLNNIFYNNKFGSTKSNCSGTTQTSSGGNLSDTASTDCRTSHASDLNNSDPLLVSLADNGGSTHTLMLGLGSPAIDGGQNTGCPSVDQRGVSRPSGTSCDIGAVER